MTLPTGNPKRQSKKPTSLGANLRTSLQTLLTIIGNRQLNYVFCIKPNDQQQTKVFDLSSVQHQVRYMSLMPLVHLWRTGYYFNLSHKTFLNRYKLVSPLTWPHYHKGTIVEGIALIIRSVPLPAAEFTIGGKRVFIRSPRTVSLNVCFRRLMFNV
jgi:myosin I